MRKKQVKKLKKIAALLAQPQPGKAREIYQRLKTIHKQNKGEI